MAVCPASRTSAGRWPTQPAKARPPLIPAIAGIVATHEGQLYLAAPVAGAEQIEFIQLRADGKPIGRFLLPATTKVLLAAGDSLLVQRPQDGELHEVRWLRLGTAK